MATDQSPSALVFPVALPAESLPIKPIAKLPIPFASVPEPIANASCPVALALYPNAKLPRALACVLFPNA
jgi:hypothetical protein